MPKANYVRDDNEDLVVPAAAVDPGQIFFLPSGWASRQNQTEASTSGVETKFRSRNKFTVPKATGVVFLAGDEVFFDYSAGNCTYKPTNDRDVFLGLSCNDCQSSESSMEVDFNKRQRIARDLLRDGFKSVLAGTPAAGGFGYPVNLGGAHIFELTATNEAQKVDALGIRGFAPTSNFIIDIVFRVINGGAGSAPDCNIGIAPATHATDFDSIAEYLALHIDGNNVNLNLQSKDGSTTVASTDTTIDYSAGADYSNEIHFKIDGRNEADIQCYLNGALVLGSTVFRLDNAASATFYPIVHLEKTSSADVFKLAVDRFTVRLGDQ